MPRNVAVEPHRLARAPRAALSLVSALAVAVALGGCLTASEDEAGTQAQSATGADVAVTLADDPEVLEALEAKGWALPSLLGAPGASLGELAANDPYATIARTLTGDVVASRAELPAKHQAGVGVGMRFNRRLFDAGWLTHDGARFELVGVVNRIDLHRQFPGSCGRIRLVYRLAYRDVTYVSPTYPEKPVLSSRLPMTLNADLRVPLGADGTCRAAALAWRVAKAEDADASWLAGALAKTRGVASIETNLQTLIEPLAMRSNMGGNADYDLRRFEPDSAGGGSWSVAGLANTPDLAAIASSPEARDELVRWLGENVDAIDRGDAFLTAPTLVAKRAVAAAPRGLARQWNRPWKRLSADAKLPIDALDLSGAKAARTPKELLRRLDQLTCQGCHAARGIVGFHLIGRDPEVADRKAPGATFPLNESSLSASPYLRTALIWRGAYLDYLAGKRSDVPDDGVQPIPERAGDYGRHCQLPGGGGEAGKDDFAGWTCGEGEVCLDLHGDEVGSCAPATGEAGDPCVEGKLDGKSDRFQDVWKESRFRLSQGFHCEATSNGYVGGMFDTGNALPGADESPYCGGSKPAYGQSVDGAMCTPAPSFKKGFDKCQADPIFCQLSSLVPIWGRHCTASRECREDFVCARVPGGASDEGVCLPPYFLFEGRVDGHPLTGWQPPAPKGT